jgi:uncharacterized membrane protein
MSQLIFSVLLLLHIASGSVGLIAGTIAMAASKRGKIHKIAGKVFFYAMAGVFLSSIYMSIAHSNLFLLLIGFFSFYLAATGYRILSLKALHFKKIQPALLDYCIVLSLLLLVKANMFGLVTLSFGCLAAWFGYSDLIKFKHPPADKLHWIASHGMRMAGAYTATITAFIVVNVHIEQQWLLWMLTAVVVTPIAQKQVKKITQPAL